MSEEENTRGSGRARGSHFLDDDDGNDDGGGVGGDILNGSGNRSGTGNGIGGEEEFYSLGLGGGRGGATRGGGGGGGGGSNEYGPASGSGLTRGLSTKGVALLPSGSEFSSFVGGATTMEEGDAPLASTSRARLPSTSTEPTGTARPSTISNDATLTSASTRRKRRASPPPRSKRGQAQPDPAAEDEEGAGEGEEVEGDELQEVDWEGERKKKVEQKLKVRLQIQRKKIVRPVMPPAFLPGGMDEDLEQMEEERKTLLEKGLDPYVFNPCTSLPSLVLVETDFGFHSDNDRKYARDLLATLSAHRTLYKTAYDALNDELIKIQIEESVLRNLKIAAHVSLSVFFSPSLFCSCEIVETDCVWSPEYERENQVG